MSLITFYIGVGIRGPIEEGEYVVGDKRVAVAYPTTVGLGLPTPVEMPKSLSTLFTVSWQDKNDRDAQRLSSKSFAKHLPVYDAIDSINELLLAFKLVRVGHADGLGIRTIGIGDTLFHISKIGDTFTGNMKIGLKMYGRYYKWAASPDLNPDDPSGTTALAKSHIGADTFQVARRYVRCFELLEHGFYSEAFIVAFSVLDDLIQQMLHSLLASGGMEAKEEREELLRGIKERRLKIFLGPLLKVICGKDFADLWPAGGGL